MQTVMDFMALMEERLEQLVYTYQLNNLFKGSFVTHINTIGSDHCPIIINVNYRIKHHSGRRSMHRSIRFHYEEF